jgi:hypothetical protein
MEEKKTAEDRISTFAQRLKDKLAGSPEAGSDKDILSELLDDSQLDAVSGGHAQHISP